MTEYTYRTFDMDPPAYERELADALFTIMGRNVHDPTAIVAALNQSGPKPLGGSAWTDALFMSELKRMGSWTNSTGAPVGTHSVPGTGGRVNGK